MQTMNTIAAIVRNVVQTATLAPSMRAPGNGMQTRPAHREGVFQTFKTFHDPVLEGMLGEAELFVSELPWKKRPAFLATMMGGPCEDARSIVPRWLSFLGQSGTGKTFLSQLTSIICLPSDSPAGFLRATLTEAPDIDVPDIAAAGIPTSAATPMPLPLPLPPQIGRAHV